MSLYVDIAERSSGYCQECARKIMRGEQRLRIYSAHHSVAFCKECAIHELERNLQDLLGA